MSMGDPPTNMDVAQEFVTSEDTFRALVTYAVTQLNEAPPSFKFELELGPNVALADGVSPITPDTRESVFSKTATEWSGQIEVDVDLSLFIAPGEVRVLYVKAHSMFPCQNITFALYPKRLQTSDIDVELTVGEGQTVNVSDAIEPLDDYNPPSIEVVLEVSGQEPDSFNPPAHRAGVFVYDYYAYTNLESFIGSAPWLTIRNDADNGYCYIDRFNPTREETDSPGIILPNVSEARLYVGAYGFSVRNVTGNLGAYEQAGGPPVFRPLCLVLPRMTGNPLGLPNPYGKLFSSQIMLGRAMIPDYSAGENPARGIGQLICGDQRFFVNVLYLHYVPA